MSKPNSSPPPAPASDANAGAPRPFKQRLTERFQAHTGFLTHLWGDLRQLCYPAEFRIARPLPGPPLAGVQPLFEALRQSIETPPPAKEEDEKFLAALATRLWRVRAGLRRSDSLEPLENAERPYRQVERMLAALEDRGVTLLDKTGDFYDPGLAAKVVVSEPMAGIGREVIKETIEPAVFKNGRLIQMAQIVVGVPAPARPPSPLPGDQAEPQ